MNTPTPTAVIIKEEFDSIFVPYYKWLDMPRTAGCNHTLFTLDLNQAYQIIRRRQRKANKIYDTENQDINLEFIATLPVSVKIDYAILYYRFSGIFHTTLSKNDIYRIITQEECNAHERNFKNAMITQSKCEAFLDTNVSAYLNLDVITHVLQFLL